MVTKSFLDEDTIKVGFAAVVGGGGAVGIATVQIWVSIAVGVLTCIYIALKIRRLWNGGNDDT